MGKPAPEKNWGPSTSRQKRNREKQRLGGREAVRGRIRRRGNRSWEQANVKRAYSVIRGEIFHSEGGKGHKGVREMPPKEKKGSSLDIRPA